MTGSVVPYFFLSTILVSLLVFIFDIKIVRHIGSWGECERDGRVQMLGLCLEDERYARLQIDVEECVRARR